METEIREGAEAVRKLSNPHIYPAVVSFILIALVIYLIIAARLDSNEEKRIQNVVMQQMVEELKKLQTCCITRRQ